MVSVFRLFALAAFGVGVVSLLVAYQITATPKASEFEIGRLVLGGAVLLVSATGLFLHRKWGALIFSLSLWEPAVRLIIGSLLKVPWPWAAFNILFGLLLLSPSVVTFRYWHMLVWRGRRWI